MKLLYNLGIRAYGLAIRLAAPFHKKARLWVEGRRDWERRLARALGDREGWIWMHCSSLGEFEQGRPLIEAIKERHPHQRILLSFFSPSGFELRKHYPLADHVCYLPLDTPRNADLVMALVKPRLLIHVKYDLWLNLISAAHARNVPQVLVSALLRPQSRFLTSWMRGEYRQAFAAMTWTFTQDQQTRDLLHLFAKNERITVAGDTRFDRVAQLPGKFEPIPEVERFIAGRECIVAGSPWPPDEAILLPVVARLRDPGRCWIIAPHEIHAAHIDRHIAASGGRMVKYSRLDHATPDADVLWIDNIGMLSRLYHYASLVYVGGGFGVGIHNTQEPAVYGRPVIFGPKYEKFQEAVDMVASGGARSVATAPELEAAMLHWLGDAARLAADGQANQAYMQSKTGATAAIIHKLDIMGYLPRN